jgi:hypothetical protein
MFHAESKNKQNTCLTCSMLKVKTNYMFNIIIVHFTSINEDYFYFFQKHLVTTDHLKFCTKISGLNLHQMEHLSGNNIFSPIISKNLSGVPLREYMFTL